MALEDLGGGGGGLAPSEPAQPSLPALPLPPLQLPNFGGFLSGFGNVASQGIFGRPPQQVGQGFSQAGTESHALWDQDITPFIDKTTSPLIKSSQDYSNNVQSATQQGGFGAGLLAAGTDSPLREAAGQAVHFAGQQLNAGLQNLASATAPSQIGPRTPGMPGIGDFADYAKGNIHSGAILGQGVGNLLQDTPGIEQDLMQSFQEGLSTTFSNDPDADMKQRDAINKMLGGMGKISDDLFNAQLMHVAIRDSLMSNGASEQDANSAADYIAQPISTIASFAAPGGMGKVMLAQFVGQLISDPGAAIHSFIDMNQSGEGEQQTTGDFTHLFGKTYAWLSGRDSAPTPEEVSKGFNALAYDIGLGGMAIHTAVGGGKAVGQTRSSFIRGLTGSDPSGAKDISNGTANLQQADQTSPTGEAGETGEAPPAGEASSSKTPGGASEGSKAAIADVSTAVAKQVAPAESIPEANTIPLSPGAGGIRLDEPVNGFNVSGEALNRDSAQLVNQATQHLQQQGLTDSVTNVHIVHGEQPYVAGGYSTDHPQSITIDLKNAYQRPDPSEFIADAQSFVSRTDEARMNPEYADAVTQGLENVHKLIYSTPEEGLREIAAHEALHADTWARTAANVGDRTKIDALPHEDQSIASMAVGLFNSLKESGVGQRWLAHDSTQASIGSDLKAIEGWINGKSDSIDTSHDGPLVHLLEHFNYQLQWDKGLSSHPYSLQAGDHAYTESFYNRAPSDEAAQLASQWFDSTREHALANVQQGTHLYSTPSGGSVYSRPSRGGADRGAADQKGLGPEASESPKLQEIVNKTNQVINNAEGEPKPGVIPEKKPGAPPDWRQLSTELAQASPNHPLAALRGIAMAAQRAFDKVDKAIEADVPAEDLHKYATDLSFEIARLRGAHELYTSATASKLLDKDHADYKATRTVARQIEQSPASPNEKAQMAALKMGHTLEEARKLMKDSHLGLDSTAHNWHPDFKNLLLGEMGKVAKDAKVKDGRPVLGIHNIPMPQLVETETLKDLQSARRSGIVNFKADQQAILDEISKAKMRKTVGDSTAEATIKSLNKQLKDLRKQQGLEAARLESRIANHPDSHQSRVVNQPPLTTEEVRAAATPDPSAHRRILEAQAEATAQKTDQELAKEAAAANGRLAAPVPTIFGPDSVIAENRLTEDGRYAGLRPVRPVAEGTSVFGPDYADRVAELRQYGGDYFRLADEMHDFQKSMADHHDPAESEFHPAQQFSAFWQRATVEVPWRVDRIKKLLNSVVKDVRRPGESIVDVGRRLLRPIDNLDEAERRQHMSELTPKEAAVANMLNEFWRASKSILMDPDFGKPVLEHYVDNYVPHIVLEDPDGRPLADKKGNTSASKWSDFARARLTQGAEGEPVFKTLDALSKMGYKVQTDLAEVWAEHSLSAFKAMQIRQLLSTLGRNIYRAPDGSFVGYPIIHSSHWQDARQMRDFQGTQNMRHVNLGPGARVLNMFFVHPELADYIERFSKIDRWGDIAKGAATIARTLSGIFKFFQFSINTSHAFRVASNMAVMSSKFGVDAPFNVWKMYDRANRALLPEDRTLLRRVNPLRKGNEDFAIKQVANAEKALTDVRNRLINMGIDPSQPLDPDHPQAQQIAPIMDQLNDAAEKLRAERDHWESTLHLRDKQMASELMGKGLTLPKEVIDASDQGWAAPLNERIPLLKQFHQWMWKDVVWNGMLGMALHMSDQHIQRAAKDLHGWDGKGGARVAESLLTPQERDAALRQAVYDSKVATGLLAKSDMSMAWQTYGRAAFLSAPWTLGQLRTSRDAILGNSKLGRKLGRPDLSAVSPKMVQSGFGAKEAKYFDNLHTKMARRMLFGGTLKMAMTMAVAQPMISWMLTGQPTNMIQNFQKDPTHTFDTWAGSDPATGNDIWLSSGFFGWQREMAEYGLTALKSAQEGKSPWEVATAPLIRFSNKNVPLVRTALELVTGTEIGKWMYGWSDPSISGDTDIQAMHQALNARGIPDAGSLEDRIIYALRTIAPAPSFPTPIPILRDANLKEVKDDNGMPIPLYTDLRSILGQVFNPGGFFSDPMKTAAYIMGAQETTSPSLQQIATQQAQNAQNQETQAQTLLRNQSMRDLNVAFQHGDLEKVAAIRDANGLTDKQVRDAITWTNSYNVNGSQVTTKGMLSGGGPTTTNKPVTIGGTVLSEDQKAQYEKDISNREVYAQYQLKDNPYFASATQTERASMLNSTQALVDKWTQREWDYKVNGTGQPLTDDEFRQLVTDSIQNRSLVKNMLYASPSFMSATPMEQQKMLDSYSTFANTVAWDRLYGNTKGSLTEGELPMVISTAISAEQNVKDYIGQTPFYQQAPPEEQQRMINEYSTLTQKAALDMYTGKLKGVIPPSLASYVQSTVNVEESAKFLLHQSDFYQSASLNTQKSLDSKYEKMSRTIAVQDWESGQPVTSLSQTNQAFEMGSERTVLGHLMADQAFNDLQKQYGGAEKIKSYSDELSAIQKQVRESTNAPPKTINYMVTQVKNRYLAANPEYAAYLKARTNWERGSELGRLYASLNADDAALAAADTSMLEDKTGVADPLSQLADNSAQAIMQPQNSYVDSVTDPNSATPYVDLGKQ